jgi:hypothetical protein
MLPPFGRKRELPFLHMCHRSILPFALISTKSGIPKPTRSRLNGLLTIFLYLDYIPLIPSTEGVFMRRREGGVGRGPAGVARNHAPGRLRGSARAALGPLCEELAGLDRRRHAAESRKRGPELSQWHKPLARAAMERWEAQHPSPRVRALHQARGGADRKASPKGSRTPLASPGAPFPHGKEKGKRRTPTPTKIRAAKLARAGQQANVRRKYPQRCDQPRAINRTLRARARSRGRSAGGCARG